MRYNPNGLTQEQVERSRAEKGENVLTPVKDNSAWKLFIEKFEDPIIQVLLFAAALSLVVGIIQKVSGNVIINSENKNKRPAKFEFAVNELSKKFLKSIPPAHAV